MPSPTHSDLLWTRIRLAEGRLFSASNLFWTHPDLTDILPQFLIQLHRVMQSGISLMRTAKDCALALPADPVAAQTATYLETHIEEEKDHDQWLLSDIQSLGIDAADILRATPLPAVVSLLGAQYYWMFHMHPVAIFGYLIVLEGYPPLVDQLEQIRQHTGLPVTAFRCLKSHAEDDPEHINTLNRTLDNMPLTPDQSKYLALSAFHTIDAVASILEELLAAHAASSHPEVVSPSHA
ncbi:MAG TPA: iron-containing redox enzyme family protein [Edaphobacter sp.]